jgi:hypothetical protein
MAGSAGGSGPGTAGTPGAAGAGGTPGAAGTPGTGGTPGGTAGTPGAGGTTGGGGTGAYGYKPFVCPGGNYGPQMSTKTTAICNSGGFKFNYAYNEGPTWIATQNAFFFSNFVQGNGSANKTAGDIIKVSLAADGSATCEVWVHDAGCNGLGVAADGNLLGACHGPRAVMKYDVVTKQGTIVSSMAGGKMYDSPNDLISTRNGNIYFSNTQYELGGRPPGGIGSALVRIDPMGMATVVQTGGLNGMALSPDEKLLYVVQMGVWNINPDGSPGTKTNMGGPAATASRWTARVTSSTRTTSTGRTPLSAAPTARRSSSPAAART